MKIKDFLRLPFDREFHLTDGIWDYVLRKEKNDIGVHYRVMIKGGSNFSDSFGIYEEPYEEECDYYTYKSTALKINTMVGGFSFHSDIGYSIVHKLKIVTTGSFKEWSQKLRINNENKSNIS